MVEDMKKRRNTLNKSSFIGNVWNFIENFVIAIIWLMKFLIKVPYRIAVKLIRNILQAIKR